MRNVAVVVVVALVIVGCARPNPRIKSVVRKEGPSAQATAFTYDGGHPKSVSVDLGGGQSKTFALTFDGGKLTKMAVTHNSGGEETDDTTLTYDGDRLTKASTTIGGTEQTLTTTFEYDDSGRIAKVEGKTEFGSGTNIATSTFTYGDDGGLAKIVEEGTFDDNNAGANTSTITKTITYGDDGKIEKIARKSDHGETGQLTAAYEDGVLTALADNGDFGGAEISTSSKITYKDGRIKRVATASSDTGSLELDFEYEDGDVGDIDVTPSDLGFAGLWDLRGGSYNGFDAHTQAARFAGANW